MKPTVLVLGSGPIQIGQGIELDYSCVHCVWSLRETGYRAVILNNNRETRNAKTRIEALSTGLNVTPRNRILAPTWDTFDV